MGAGDSRSGEELPTLPFSPAERIVKTGTISALLFITNDWIVTTPRVLASPLGQMLYSEELKSGMFKINSLWELECAKGTELPGQHIKQDLGLGFFFLMKKNKSLEL